MSRRAIDIHEEGETNSVDRVAFLPKPDTPDAAPMEPVAARRLAHTSRTLRFALCCIRMIALAIDGLEHPASPGGAEAYGMGLHKQHPAKS